MATQAYASSLDVAFHFPSSTCAWACRLAFIPPLGLEACFFLRAGSAGIPAGAAGASETTTAAGADGCPGTTIK